MIQFWSICRNTFVQTIRQPIYLVLIALTFAVLVISVPLAAWTMGTDFRASDQKMLEELGLSTLLVAGMLVAAFSASGALTREMEDQTALTVISKPVSRATFVLGKFGGVAGAVTAAFYLCALAFLMTIRHRVMPAASDTFDWPVIVLGCSALAASLVVAIAGNYFFGWTFTSSNVVASLALLTLAAVLIGFIGKEWQIVPFAMRVVDDADAGRYAWAIREQLIVATVLMYLAVMVLTSVAVAVSTRFGQVATLLISLGVFVIGSVHPYLFGRHSDLAAARGLGWVFPKLGYFYKLDALATDRVIPWAFVGISAVYCGLYAGGILCIGLALFQSRQLDSQGASSSMPGAMALLSRVGQAGGLLTAVVLVPLMLSWPGYRALPGYAYALAGGLALGGAAAFLLWTWFARGVRWTYWALGVVHLAALARALALAAMPEAAEFVRFGAGPARIFLQTAVNAADIVILLLPGTRRHFRSNLGRAPSN